MLPVDQERITNWLRLLARGTGFDDLPVIEGRELFRLAAARECLATVTHEFSTDEAALQRLDLFRSRLDSIEAFIRHELRQRRLAILRHVRN